MQLQHHLLMLLNERSGKGVWQVQGGARISGYGCGQGQGIVATSVQQGLDWRNTHKAKAQTVPAEFS
jgi:hypothetical protein